MRFSIHDWRSIMKRKRSKTTLLVLFVCLQITFSLVNHTRLIEAAKPLEDVQGIFLVALHVNLGEFNTPKDFLEEYGCSITVVGPTSTVTAEGGSSIEVDILINNLNNLSYYEFLYVPGGGAPDNLIEIPEAIDLVVDAYNDGLVLGAICAGPLVFAEADIISGRNISGNTEVKTDIENAGANFIADGIVIDGPFVTADYAYLNDFVQQGLVKALGYYEYNPPILVDYEFGFIFTGSTESLSVIAEITDEFAIARVYVELHKYNQETSQFEYSKEAQLSSNFENNTYSVIIDEVLAGNYSAWIKADDVLGNVGIYEDLYRFVIKGTKKISVSTLVILSGLIICAVFTKTYLKKDK